MILPAFERFIFDLNEGMENLGLLETDMYISHEKFILSIIIATLITSALIWVVFSNKKFFERVMKYILFVVVPAMVIALAYFKPYVFMVYMLIVGFMGIVLYNKKYSWLREKLNKFF